MKNTTDHHNNADQAAETAREHYRRAYAEMLRINSSGWTTAEEIKQAAAMLHNALLQANMAKAYAETCHTFAPGNHAATDATNAMLAAIHAKNAADGLAGLAKTCDNRSLQALVAESEAGDW
jgi:hypothetical protein